MKLVYFWKAKLMGKEGRTVVDAHGFFEANNEPIQDKHDAIFLGDEIEKLMRSKIQGRDELKFNLESFNRVN